ncbi:MAG TPA: GNAT family N-acetyltransferase [Caulobacteraceae bacterium]|jgi:GNAT superfamily N-acetyltransferase|nr:GNAT family N-acetyltransferase [Caulobacteraceae bacterium]
MTDGVIRRAGIADAETLSALSAATFSATFAHLYPPSDLAAFLEESYALERSRAQLADPRIATWLLEVENETGGEAVGYAMAGPCGLPHPDVTPGCGELKRIYMLRAWQGGGRGSRLLAAALAWLEAETAGSLWIGVWSQNLGAQRLYGRMGFDKVGEYEFKVGQTRDHEFILRRG